LTKSAIAFWQQLAVFGLYDLDASDVVLDEYDSVFPGGRPHYLQSRQAQNTLPLEFFTSVGNWTAISSLVVICAVAPFLWRKRSARLVGLSVVIVSTVVANALVTGPLSMVEDRFQSRVIWLLSFLAGLFVMVWLDRRQALCGAGTPAREI
jgi:dipeptide/tripeptide permease